MTLAFAPVQVLASETCPPFDLLFFPFNTTLLVTQESVVLSECRILHYIIFWPQMSYYRGF